MTTLLRITVFLLLLVSAGKEVLAQSYPSRPIRIIAPGAAGGAGDTIDRIIAQELSVRLKQSVIVENKPGTNVGELSAAQATADGYTLLETNLATMAINPEIVGSLPYDPRAFEPISMVAGFPVTFIANPSLGVNTVAEFLTVARNTSPPIQYASIKIGSLQHLAGEMLQKTAGIKLAHVPYNGGAPAITAVLSGEVRAGFVAMQKNVLELMAANQLRVLAVGSLRRSALAPTVPTMNESGLPGFEANVWIGYVAPPRTPADIRQLLNREIRAVLDMDAVRQRITGAGADVQTSATPDEFAATIRSDIAKWGGIARESGVKAQ